jgi:phosphotransferase system enzyme I (PtsI)
MANIEHPNQTYLLWHHKLEGIGLFRTEFMALERGFVPSEDEQFLAYRTLIENTKGIPVVFRTFDIGADKGTAGLHQCVGMNPALGLRGIRRHLLREPGELRDQIKAILRAAMDAKIGVMFPMVTDLNDIKKAKEHMFAAKEELRREKKVFAEHAKIGAMIEVPSAAILTAEILGLVDFVSIGTNDLLQYFTGADRDNPEVLAYHDPGGSAFGWLLDYIITKAREIGRDKDVNICGEIAGNAELVPSLLKMGFRSLSISPVHAEQIRTCIANTSVTQSKEDSTYV